MGDENDFNGHEIMTDDDFERAIELMQEQAMLGDGDNVSELLSKHKLSTQFLFALTSHALL